MESFECIRDKMRQVDVKSRVLVILTGSGAAR